MENITYSLRRLLASAENVAILSLCILLSYLVVVPIHRLYFHPLSKFKGPRLWAISRIPFAYYSVCGTLHNKLVELHAKYGDVVRVAPAELVYINEEAYADIYQPNKITRQQLFRDNKLVPEPLAGGPHGIIFTTNEDDHARMRRNLAPMFTETAMRAQEPLMNKYFDLLIQRLHENCFKPINIVTWFNLVTFDITGKLTFGESFDCLDNSELHPWVKLTFSWLKGQIIMGMALKLYPLDKILTWMVPKSLIKQMMEHQEFTNDKLARRLARKDVPQDFLSYAQNHLDEPVGMSLGELQETVSLVIVAGSETSATSLSSQAYFLASNPACFQRLKDEIRGTFKNESEINIQSVSGLEYTLAVIEESLRLFPPAANSFVTNRVTPPEGSIICGEHIAGGTIVNISPFAAFRSPTNFKDSTKFVPERWLPEGQDKYGGDKKKVSNPFGMGPRGCLGKSLAYAEMKVILARVVWNFDWELVEKDVDWISTMKVFVAWEKTPMLVQLKPVVR